MNISRILFLFILPILAFSYEVKFTKKFEKEVVPENIYMDLKITYKYDNESIVNRTLSMFTKEIERNNSVKSKQTYYSVRKEYKYRNNDREDDGYVGEVSYKLWSNNQNDLDKLIDKLYIKKTENSMSILTSNLTWDLSEKKKKEIYDEIRNDAQSWGIEYQKTLEAKFQGSCKFVSMIEEGLRDYDNYPRNNHMMMKSSMESDSSMPMPRQDEVTYDTTFIFHFDCDKNK